MIEHCLAALEAAREEKRYRAYVTDALMAIAENTSRFAGGRHMTARWADGDPDREEVSGDAIALEVIRRAGLRPDPIQTEVNANGFVFPGGAADAGQGRV